MPTWFGERRDYVTQQELEEILQPIKGYMERISSIEARLMEQLDALSFSEDVIIQRVSSESDDIQDLIQRVSLLEMLIS